MNENRTHIFLRWLATRPGAPPLNADCYPPFDVGDLAAYRRKHKLPGTLLNWVETYPEVLDWLGSKDTFLPRHFTSDDLNLSGVSPEAFWNFMVAPLDPQAKNPPYIWTIPNIEHLYGWLFRFPAADLTLAKVASASVLLTPHMAVYLNRPHTSPTRPREGFSTLHAASASLRALKAFYGHHRANFVDLISAPGAGFPIYDVQNPLHLGVQLRKTPPKVAFWEAPPLLDPPEVPYTHVRPPLQAKSSGYVLHPRHTAAEYTKSRHGTVRKLRNGALRYVPNLPMRGKPKTKKRKTVSTIEKAATLKVLNTVNSANPRTRRAVSKALAIPLYEVDEIFDKGVDLKLSYIRKLAKVYGLRLGDLLDALQREIILREGDL